MLELSAKLRCRVSFAGPNLKRQRSNYELPVVRERKRTLLLLMISRKKRKTEGKGRKKDLDYRHFISSSSTCHLIMCIFSPRNKDAIYQRRSSSCSLMLDSVVD
ncbi:uncharacterized protein LOC132295104 isoform X2 [Cornus florida]|uniref:uncharacterized protein LOC132295104 isoform X2 n=1 Tax=Cornus florida TaxID=4283 RepID=UPI00289E2E41|nr:uncharacterized protein LOC132295104 isoform X2 [Cornus florida]